MSYGSEDTADLAEHKNMPSFQAHLKQPGQASKSWHENIDERDLPFYSRSVGSTREPKRRSRVNGVLGGAIVEGVASKLASHAESYLSLLSVVQQSQS